MILTQSSLTVNPGLVNDKGKRICYINLPGDKSIACNDPVGSALKDLLLKRSCFIVNSTVMYRKSALLTIGGFVEADWPLSRLSDTA